MNHTSAAVLSFQLTVTNRKARWEGVYDGQWWDEFILENRSIKASWLNISFLSTYTSMDLEGINELEVYTGSSKTKMKLALSLGQKRLYTSLKNDIFQTLNSNTWFPL